MTEKKNGVEIGGQGRERITPQDQPSLDRRHFLRRGALGVAGAALLGGEAARPRSLGAEVDSLAQEAGGKTSATGGGVRAWPDRPPGWWRTRTPVRPPPPDGAVEYREIDLDVRITRHELLPGVSFHALAFNGEVPGPELRLQEGEWVKVNFTNETELLHTIHWHGMDVQYENDGVPFVTQEPVMPGKTFEYRFQALPAGTRWYHCHYGTRLHMLHAMHGALIVEPEVDPIKEEFGYTWDYTLVLSSFDTNFAREEMNFMLGRMKERMWLMRKGKLDAKTRAVFEDREAFLAAVEAGYEPPYLPSRHQTFQGAALNHNFFAINGKSYPMTEPLFIRKGETIRVRFINAGPLEHYFHLHGHQFWVVAKDGNVLHEPTLENTLPLPAGRTVDLIIEGYNPGYWSFHDHNTSRATNNGMYPGGMFLQLIYEEMADYDGYRPKVALDE
ncbi:MAG: multicopper oxidase family protein [Gemmatimonadota bacterium]